MEINGNFGVGKVGHFLDMLDTKQYLQMRHEALKNDGLVPVDDALKPYIPDIFFGILQNIPTGKKN